MRIDNEMITINAENTANSVATLRLRGTNSNADHSQLVDMKSSVDGHVTSSKFTISTRNQGTMNDHFVIDSEGKVGIGTTSPLAPLHVYGTQNTTLFTLSTSSSAQPYSNFTSRSITFKDSINNSNIVFRYEPPSSSLSINGEPTIGFLTDVSEGAAKHFNIRFNGKNLFTVSGNGMIKVNSYLNLTPVSTPPSTPAKGDIYMDNSDNTLKYFNGTNWENAAGSSSSTNSDSNTQTLIYTSDGF